MPTAYDQAGDDYEAEVAALASYCPRHPGVENVGYGCQDCGVKALRHLELLMARADAQHRRWR